MSAAAPALAPELEVGLRRLKLAAMRALAPELLVTAKTQRWAPEELVRTLVEAEICARDAAGARHRLKAAAFPVVKTLEEFDVAASSIPRATFDYLASLEWITARENLCLVGPAGTGISHTLIAGLLDATTGDHYLAIDKGGGRRMASGAAQPGSGDGQPLPLSGAADPRAMAGGGHRTTMTPS